MACPWISQRFECPLGTGSDAVDQRDRHLRCDVGGHACEARAAEDHSLCLEPIGRLAAGLGQQLASADRIAGELRAGGRYRVDASQRLAVAERIGQAREHRPPAVAAGHDGEAPVPRGGRERRLGQAAHRHAGAIAQRKKSGIAEAPDQYRVRLESLRLRHRPAVEHCVVRDRVAGFVRDVGCAETRRQRMHRQGRAGGGLHVVLQQRGDGRRGVRIDDEQAGHRGVVPGSLGVVRVSGAARHADAAARPSRARSPSRRTTRWWSRYRAHRSTASSPSRSVPAVRVAGY